MPTLVPTAVPTTAPIALPTAAPTAEPALALAALPVARALDVAGVMAAGATGAAANGRPVLTAAGIQVPPQIDPSKPVRVLLTFHGMGGSGETIAKRFGECAARNNWLLIAPTFAYRDYMDPVQVRQDDGENLPRIKELLDNLPLAYPELTFEPRALLYGFSRGAQVAHRFTLFYPDQVARVASLAAGSYTLPNKTDRTDNSAAKTLTFPFGVGDLERYAGHTFDAAALKSIPFWVGVGSKDTTQNDVPRAWDPFIGKTRIERAQKFVSALQSVGAQASLTVAEGAGHEETAALRNQACDFLAGQ